MLYWEVVPKVGPDRKLLPEMILVCNALRNDLMSPNEFIRGCMLRFLCKMREPELLEPLIPSVKQCLEHRHSYVRRNAALCVYSLCKHFGEQLLPDGPELMEKFIMNEYDISARRNAFLMLFNEAESIAIDFLAEQMDNISTFGDGFALLVLELSRKVCRRDPAQKSRFVRCLFELLRSESQAVSYEAAWTLVSLSTAPTAVRAVAQTFATLLNTSSDNNVKLIVLDRLIELKKHHSKIVQEILMDILRALSSPVIEICKKVLALAIDLVGPRNIEEVMLLLKREIIRAQENERENGQEYKVLLIQAIHKCATRFAEVADSVVLVLLDFLSGDGGYDVMMCVKSIVEQYPSFRAGIMRKIIDKFDELTTQEALRVGIWMLGEYSTTIDPNTNQPMTVDAFDAIRGELGESPFPMLKTDGKGKAMSLVADTSAGAPVVPEKAAVTTTITKNIVLADGTYASVTHTETTGGPSAADAEAMPVLRRLIATGDILIGTTACVSLTKLYMHATSQQTRLKMETLMMCSGIGKLAEARRGTRTGLYADSLDRLTQCVRMLLDPAFAEQLGPIFLNAAHDSYASMVAGQKAAKLKASEAEKKGKASNPDDLIQFRQLRAQAVQGGIEVDLMDADDISRATGFKEGADPDAAKLRHVYQLTGLSDPVYAEATVMVHDYDITLEMLIINRTPETLTNLTVELATMGDLKIVERPQSHTIGPLDERKLRANIKVSSTETGHIFGTIVFDNASSAKKTYVHLNEIQLDIMDYIRPGECKNEDFRTMWAEFEWENKVTINTTITNLQEFLDHIITNTNMTNLSNVDPDADGVKGANFLAANLYARSVFGEDALVNLSVEKRDDNFGLSSASVDGTVVTAAGEAAVEKAVGGKLTGYIRIRSKTQGIALSLGDRITLVQRSAGGSGSEGATNAGPTGFKP